MPLPSQAELVLRLPANQSGRDFVVGDLHGCYKQLVALMQHVQFDPAVDRMFSVGDLVDRGPENIECVNLIYQPWFYAVRGNHEQMMIEYYLRSNELNLVDYGTGHAWIPNGGNWSFNHDASELLAIARDLDMLPIVIVVGERDQRFNIVHAELKRYAVQQHSSMMYLGGDQPIPVTDEMIDNWQFTSIEEQDMIWGRQIVADQQETRTWHDPQNMSLTYVGHTPLRQTVIVQRQIYLDHGCVFGVRAGSAPSSDRKLVLASPSEQLVYQLSTVDNSVTSVPYSNLQRLP